MQGMPAITVPSDYDPFIAPRIYGGGLGNIHTATDGRDILVNTPDGWEVDKQALWWDGPADGDGTGGPFGNPPPDAELGPTSSGWASPVVSRLPAADRR